jgi:tRNA A37 threonylcarbamoyladenosine dehydratase
VTPTFSPGEAFERNFGLITREEQNRLFSARVAIAGCGGVGGLHAHVLARLGIGRFRLADFDTFSVVNFNRQIGATVETVGKSKVAVTTAMIRSIDPLATIEILEEGVTPAPTSSSTASISSRSPGAAPSSPRRGARACPPSPRDRSASGRRCTFSVRPG